MIHFDRVGEHINTLSTSMVSEQFVRRLTSQVSTLIVSEGTKE